jgi:hypothetical protein
LDYVKPVKQKAFFILTSFALKSLAVTEKLRDRLLLTPQPSLCSTDFFLIVQHYPDLLTYHNLLQITYYFLKHCPPLPLLADTWQYCTPPPFPHLISEPSGQATRRFLAVMCPVSSLAMQMTLPYILH